MNYIEQVYGFQNPSIINQRNFNLSFEMYSLQQNLKNHIDYSFKRLCSDLHQMFQFSPGKSNPENGINREGRGTKLEILRNYPDNEKLRAVINKKMHSDFVPWCRSLTKNTK